MKKLFLLIALLFSLIMETNAKTEEFSYFPRPAKDSYLTAWGLGAYALDQISVAVRLNHPELVGKKIVQIDCYINCDEKDISYINNSGVFITTGSDQNVPRDDYNILPHTNADVKMGSLDGFPFPVISHKLKNPVLVTEEPIFIGYDMEVQYYEGSTLRYPVLAYLTVSDIPGALYVKAKLSEFKWGTPKREDQSGTAAAIIITLESSENEEESGSQKPDPVPEPNPNAESGVYMGLISFSNTLNEYPMSLLSSETKEEYINFINGMNMGNNTLLYYGVDEAISVLKDYSYPSDLKKAILITFTDGLDEGSLAKRPDIMDDREYAEKLHSRILQTQIQGIDLDAYTIGVKGKDLNVNDEELDKLFMLNLQSLASTVNNALPVEGMDRVKKELDIISDDLWTQTSQRIISFSIPVMSNNERCRFTLDGTSDNDAVDAAEMWIDGTFDKVNYTFKDITYHGFATSTGNIIQTPVDPSNDLNVIFTFEDCRDLKGNILNIKPEDIVQWKYLNNSGRWYHNSENVLAENMKIEDIRSSVAIMFVLDCSNSLGASFPQLKDAAISFINRLVEGGISDDKDNNDNTGDKGDNEDEENDNNGGDKDDNNDVQIIFKDNTDWSQSDLYNLQGLKVVSPVPGIYIQRAGTKTRKVIIR